jgi:hypothetical protein
LLVAAARGERERGRDGERGAQGGGRPDPLPDGAECERENDLILTRELLKPEAREKVSASLPSAFANAARAARMRAP